MRTIIIIAVVGIVLLVGGSYFSKSLASKDPNTVATSGLHWHPELEIYVHGEKQEIPQNVGLGVVHSPIHTHDDVPVLHMEFSGKVVQDDTRLGNFFQIWEKEFSSEQIFEYKNGPEGIVRMEVNGVENTEFENYRMHDGDKIVIRYE